MMFRYVLDEDHNPVPEPDLERWAQWLEEHGNRVACTTVGEAVVSTIFLGLDVLGNGRLFETMIFTDNGKALDYQTRANTWEEALAMHQAAIRYVKSQEQ